MARHGGGGDSPPSSPDSTTSTTSNPFSDRHETSRPPSPENPFSDYYAIGDNGSAMSLDNMDWAAQRLDGVEQGLTTAGHNLASHQASASSYGTFGSMIAAPLNTTITQGADTVDAAAKGAAGAARGVRDSAETMRTTDSDIADGLGRIGQDTRVDSGPPGSTDGPSGRPDGDRDDSRVPPPPELPGENGPTPPPDAKPMPNPDTRPLGDRVDDIRQQLGLKGDVGTVIVPTGNRPDGRPYTLDTPVMDLPPENRHGLTSEQQGMKIGDLMGFPEEAMADPEFAGSHPKEAMDMQGGGGYNGDNNLLMLDDKHNDNPTLFHELGHARQNQGGFNAHNSQNTLLEFHNVLINENAHHGANGQPPRLDYSPQPGSRPATDWNGLRDYVQGEPVTVNGRTLTLDPGLREQSAKLFDQIDQLTGPGGPYAGNGAQVRDNLIKEFFAKEKLMQR